MSPRDVLVTGAGRGLGAATTSRLVAAGWRVFAADLEPPAPADGVVPVRLDVTAQASVDAALATVSDETSGLGAVVHFAGLLRVGSVAEVPTEMVARVLDVNVLGVHRVTRAFLPLLEKDRGRVVVISSETGVQTAAPFNGVYAMSKHALEAYADALRRELVHVGIPVVKVQPGPFRTQLVSDSVAQSDAAARESERFSDALRGFARHMPRELAKAHDPALLAEVVLAALTEERPKPAYLVHPDRTRMLLERLPVRAADKAFALAVRAMARRGRKAR
ncbi:MAG TPA: SDR family NAD(P)-dependent oxidoreductase [Mycobacteriales bacterium]|nr:SDR family NAD(P)-dependent oxidoreductase [Mycobacteriales bacterium]